MLVLICCYSPGEQTHALFPPTTIYWLNKSLPFTLRKTKELLQYKDLHVEIKISLSTKRWPLWTLPYVSQVHRLSFLLPLFTYVLMFSLWQTPFNLFCSKIKLTLPHIAQYIMNVYFIYLTNILRTYLSDNIYSIFLGVHCEHNRQRSLPSYVLNSSRDREIISTNNN